MQRLKVEIKKLVLEKMVMMKYLTFDNEAFFKDYNFD